MLISIDIELKRWARICGGGDGLGYPPVTITWRIWREGAGAAIRAAGIAPGGSLPQDVEAVDRAVARLPDDLRAVVRLYYLDHMTVREVGASLGLSKHQAGTRLDQAHHYLAGMLEAIALPA